MSDKKVIHTYDDDIQEEDNHLPLWWQYTLYGAIVFAVFYFYAEHKISAWKSRTEAFDQEMAAARIEAAKKSGQMTNEALVAMSQKPDTVRQGREVFSTTCAACHRADAGGLIGPNLTDKYWLHGSKPENIFHCVHDGVSGKGMPTWGPVLGEEKVADVVAYVLTLRDTNVANGKPPQGEPE